MCALGSMVRLTRSVVGDGWRSISSQRASAEPSAKAVRRAWASARAARTTVELALQQRLALSNRPRAAAWRVHLLSHHARAAELLRARGPGEGQLGWLDAGTRHGRRGWEKLELSIQTEALGAGVAGSGDGMHGERCAFGRSLPRGARPTRLRQLDNYAARRTRGSNRGTAGSAVAAVFDCLGDCQPPRPPKPRCILHRPHRPPHR